MKKLSEEDDILARSTSDYSTGNHENHEMTHNQHDHQIMSHPTPEQDNSDHMAPLEVKYKECLKNHAAAIGGNSLDGCGEFMPNGEANTLEALKCSACGCHRNFHRKELQGAIYCHSKYCRCYHHSPILGHHHTASPSIRAASKANLHGGLMPANMGVYLLPSKSDEDRKTVVVGRPNGKKKLRTKFTAEQKEKMVSFAEKAGWKIRNLEDSVLQQFCQEIGIKKKVLKVWIHNNKHNFTTKGQFFRY